MILYKQKTGNEMRISDWSSDVCSSDLLELGADGVLDTRCEQTLERVGDREPQLLGPRRGLVELGEPQDALLDLRGVDRDVGAQHALGLAAAAARQSVV